MDSQLHAIISIVRLACLRRCQCDETIALCEVATIVTLALTSPTRGGHSVGIVPSWAQAAEFVSTLSIICV
jgi:hypothetical protein